MKKKTHKKNKNKNNLPPPPKPQLSKQSYISQKLSEEKEIDLNKMKDLYIFIIPGKNTPLEVYK